MSNFYGRVMIFKRRFRPPSCSKISGTVYLAGTTPQQNAIVDCFDEQDKVMVGEVLTDVNGLFTFSSGFSIRDDHTYTIVAKYDSGSQKYNSLSQPYIVAVSN